MRLEEQKFLCCIPRLRYTPLLDAARKESVSRDELKHARNEQMKAHGPCPAPAGYSGYRGTIRHEGPDLSRRPTTPDGRRQGIRCLIRCLHGSKSVSYGAPIIGLPARPFPRTSAVQACSVTKCIRQSCVSAAACPPCVCRSREQTSKGFMWRDIWSRGLAIRF